MKSIHEIEKNQGPASHGLDSFWILEKSCSGASLHQEFKKNQGRASRGLDSFWPLRSLVWVHQEFKKNQGRASLGLGSS